jgi:hypothetical protein
MVCGDTRMGAADDRNDHMLADWPLVFAIASERLPHL